MHHWISRPIGKPVWHFAVIQIAPCFSYGGLTKDMFQIQKISAHIQLLENRLAKLVSHRESVISEFDPEPSKVTFKQRDRLTEIERQIARMENSITGYRSQLSRAQGST
jgi:archaellum component FlaC